MSRVLNRSPFDPYILNHTKAQLDFILEMYSLDHPTEGKFVRPGFEDERVAPVMIKKAWADVLKGRALAEYMVKYLPSPATLAKLKTPSSPFKKRKKTK